jgi:BirA family biotin operon repressor/biotin-[acetyl-CoA-carboxylase] ligase
VFDVAEIRALLTDAALARMAALEALSAVESTNSYLLEREAPGPGRYRVALTDHQTAGRGRLGRRWVSSPGASLCLSLAYTFEATPSALPAATLPVGVAVIRALEGVGVDGAGLKWPNDIVLADGKLGGILTEVHTAGSGATIVVGIGLNVDLRQAAVRDMSSTNLGAVRDIASGLRGGEPPHARIVAALIEQVTDTLRRFGRTGLEPFLAAWRELDWLRGRRVCIEAGQQRIQGICEGIDPDGALVVGRGSSRQRVLSGSVLPLDQAGGQA